jgi:hypothetical protein
MLENPERDLSDWANPIWQDSFSSCQAIPVCSGDRSAAKKPDSFDGSCQTLVQPYVNLFRGRGRRPRRTHAHSLIQYCLSHINSRRPIVCMCARGQL